MKWNGFAVGVLAFVFCVVAIGLCEEQPDSATVCQLKSDPPAYNHKLVEVTGFVSHDFEDFTLFDPTCPSWPAVWLEYGGKEKSGTIVLLRSDGGQKPSAADGCGEHTNTAG
jgi:hypothetical protein